MMKTSSGIIVLALVISLILIPTASYAQNAANERFTYLCVENVFSQEVELIGFTNTEVVGFVFPQDVRVTLYSAEPGVVAQLQNIEPNAHNGSYRRAGVVANAYTIEGVAQDELCSSTFTELRDRVATVPIIMTTNQALFVSTTGEAVLGEAILGALGVFIPEQYQLGGLSSFQMLQLDQAPIQVTLSSGKTNDLSLMLISNKQFLLEAAFTRDTMDDAIAVSITPVSSFLKLIEREDEALDLYNIMRVENMRIYPQWGIYTRYYGGGMMQISLGGSEYVRDPAFEPGQRVAPMTIPGIQVKVYFEDDPFSPIGTHNGEIVVDDVTPEGRLIVNVPAHGRVILEGWFVEIQSPEE
ncbi:MAG: hypothetical protein GYB66_04035 [Chloroflexi bacterium]|nr:hypothetical protein [Chloroflexota bacterium]